MKIPKSIKFNGIIYPVKEVERLNGEQQWGQTTFKVPSISLERDLHPLVKEKVFIHELLHIAFLATGLDWDNKKEETAIHAWENSIYGILKENNLLK